MHKTSTVAILLVMSVCLAHAQQPETLSAMKQYARLSEDRIDLLEVLLQVSQMVNPKLNTDSCRSVVSKIAETAKYRSTTNASPRDNIRTLASTIHNTFGITIPHRPSSQISPEYGMIHFAVINKKANCLGLVTLYLIVSERLGVPLRAETVSTHITLKYDDGRTLFFVEPTTGGDCS